MLVVVRPQAGDRDPEALAALAREVVDEERVRLAVAEAGAARSPEELGADVLARLAAFDGGAGPTRVLNGTGVVVFDRPPWADVVRVGRLRTAAEATDMVLRERFWDESLLMVGPTAPPLLTAAELLCTVDPRLREAGEQVLDEEARRG